MDVWPGGPRPGADALSKEAAKGTKKSKKQQEFDSYCVNELGAVTAANLHRAGRRLEWTFLGRAIGGFKRRLVARCDDTVLSPTMPIPLNMSSISTSQLTEQSAHFLRLHHADIEVTSDLVSEYVLAGVKTEEKLRQFDPYAGNLLAWIRCNGPRGGTPTVFVAFPTGETGCELNLSLVDLSKRSGAKIQLSPQPAHMFQSPILQIVASDVTSVYGRKSSGTVVAVRTTSCVHLLRILHPAAGGGTEQVVDIFHAETGNRRIVDMIFANNTPDSATLLVVNEIGQVYQFLIAYEPKAVQHLLLREHPEGQLSSFFRLAVLPERNQFLLLSDMTLQVLPLSHDGQPSSLFRLPQGAEKMTSVLNHSCGDLTCLLTTNRIIWFNDYFSLRPAVVIKHGRHPDLNLQLQQHVFDGNPYTILMSRRDGLITVYDVSRGRDGTVHIHNIPYSLPKTHIPEHRTRGEIIFRHPADKDSVAAIILRLTHRGALHRMDVELVEDDALNDLTPIAPVGPGWAPEVQELSKLGTTRVDPGPLGGRKHDLFDLDKAYEGILIAREANETPDAVYELLDAIPMFWKHQEVPVEHALTTFDIAFGAGEEPVNSSRADFFKASALSSVRGFRALARGRIPMDRLTREAPWSHDIAPIISHFAPDMTNDPAGLASTLGKYDLTTEEDRPAESFRREAEAREQLALDLTLSSSVFSPGFSQRGDDRDDILEAMSCATSALSLDGSEPPPVTFGFLNPSKMEPASHYDSIANPRSTTDFDSSTCPLGVRLLLDEWRVGTEPQGYVYEDPYNMESRPSVVQPVSRPRSPPLKVPPERTPLPTQSVRPPVLTGPPAVTAAQHARPPVLAASQPQLPQLAPEALGASQPNRAEWGSSGASQAPFASTQILPGPHGSRPPPVKKKKRIGGF